MQFNLSSNLVDSLLARLSPRSILLNMGVSISKYAATWRCNIPCSSLRDLILFPNNIFPLLWYWISVSGIPFYWSVFGRNIVKRSDCRSDCGFFGRIIIKPTDYSLSISISTLFCLSVFLVQMCCFGHLQQRIHISRLSVITNIVKVLYGFVSVTNL